MVESSLPSTRKSLLLNGWSLLSTGKSLLLNARRLLSPAKSLLLNVRREISVGKSLLLNVGRLISTAKRLLLNVRRLLSRRKSLLLSKGRLLSPKKTPFSGPSEWRSRRPSRRRGPVRLFVCGGQTAQQGAGPPPARQIGSPFQTTWGEGAQLLGVATPVNSLLEAGCSPALFPAPGPKGRGHEGVQRLPTPPPARLREKWRSRRRPQPGMPWRQRMRQTIASALSCWLLRTTTIP
jgi:hypothetical protein